MADSKRNKNRCSFCGRSEDEVGFLITGTQAEYHTSEGRIDLVVKAPDYVYVMEFKLQGTAEEAMEQIEKKHYEIGRAHV